MEDELQRKYIVWVGYSEGWQPTGYNSLEEAVKHESYGSRKIITSGEVKIEVKEIIPPQTV